MVLTRSQGTSRSSSKSNTNSDSGNSKNSGDVKKTDSKRKSPSIIPSNDKTPLPDSSTAPVAACDKDAVAIATNDECAEKEQTKGKRSRRRNRKRKLTADHEGQTEEVDNPEASISSTSSADDGMTMGANVKHQRTVTSEEAKQDVSLANSKPAPPSTSSIMDKTQKENVLATQGTGAERKLEEEGSEATISQAVNVKDVLQLYKQESYAEGQAVKPKGQPKSGRFWKTEQTTRFSGMKQDRPLKTSWQKKMQQKAEMKNLKMFEAELKEAKSTELERKKKHRAKKIKRKLENQRKSEVVQVISNPGKIKRMKKKQLRKIEMRSMPDSSKKQVFTS
ncbi:coiled-coil domain-containing protein 86-like [Patiria miniata]|uniref:Coiled-coil domain-containing protein 86 n=1 Tax=Patiria miniata TaxID=46514 RepID=A0A914A5N4_PATMI|nr:coiled-coil domain-containing protein 86-like [Patiria miniata]